MREKLVTGALVSIELGTVTSAWVQLADAYGARADFLDDTGDLRRADELAFTQGLVADDGGEGEKVGDSVLGGQRDGQPAEADAGNEAVDVVVPLLQHGDERQSEDEDAQRGTQEGQQLLVKRDAGDAMQTRRGGHDDADAVVECGEERQDDETARQLREELHGASVARQQDAGDEQPRRDDQQAHRTLDDAEDDVVQVRVAPLEDVAQGPQHEPGQQVT